MNINASCVFSLDVLKAINHWQMFKKADPKKRMIYWGVLYGLWMLTIIGYQVLFGINKMMILLLCILVMTELFMCYWYFAIPLRQYQKLGHLRDAVNTYYFRDDVLAVESEDMQVKGQSELQYSAIVRCWETTAYLFLVMPQNQVFVVDKSTITGGTVEDIRKKLTSHLGKKYVRCNY